MEQLEKRMISHASNEHRFDPNQQKEFLGTFRERVVLGIKMTDLSPELLETIPDFLANLKPAWYPLTAKISAEIGISYQMTLMKIAKKHNLSSTIVQENEGTSPYAFIVHSDHAINLEQIEISLPLPSDNKELEKKKLSFLARLFRRQSL